MNWRGEREEDRIHGQLAAILEGLAQPGAHRALVDLTNWTLLKWLDDPAPFFDWRASMAGNHLVHPDDRPQMAGWRKSSPPVRFWRPPDGRQRRRVDACHVTVNRVELEDDVYAGLATLRQPTPDELASPQTG